MAFNHVVSIRCFIDYGKSKCKTLLFLLRIFIAVSLHVNQVKLKNKHIHQNTIICIKGQKACNFVVLFDTETKITSFEKRIVSWWSSGKIDNHTEWEQWLFQFLHNKQQTRSGDIWKKWLYITRMYWEVYLTFCD